MSTRQWVLVGGLLIAAVVLSLSGVGGLVWRPIAAVLAPWRVDLISQDEPDSSADLIAMRERLARSQAEILELRRRLGAYSEIARESGFEPSEVVAARAQVLARTRRAAHHLISIDIGAASSQTSVRRGQAVAVGWSLVGVVVGEDAGSSLVRLLSDPTSRIPARVLLDGSLPSPLASAPGVAAEAVSVVGYEDASVQGVVAGTGDPESLELRFVEDREGLRIPVGAPVVTAAGSRPIPPGLVIGVVAAASVSPASDHWQITVAPLRRLASVDSVVVLHAP